MLGLKTPVGTGSRSTAFKGIFPGGFFPDTPVMMSRIKILTWGVTYCLPSPNILLANIQFICNILMPDLSYLKIFLTVYSGQYTKTLNSIVLFFHHEINNNTLLNFTFLNNSKSTHHLQKRHWRKTSYNHVLCVQPIAKCNIMVRWPVFTRLYFFNIFFFVGLDVVMYLCIAVKLWSINKVLIWLILIFIFW